MKSGGRSISGLSVIVYSTSRYMKGSRTLRSRRSPALLRNLPARTVVRSLRLIRATSSSFRSQTFLSYSVVLGLLPQHTFVERAMLSDERRVVKEWVRTGRCRGVAYD